jgi:hypothetical protein
MLPCDLQAVGAKTIDDAKAMGNFSGWTYYSVTAIARGSQNIQVRSARWGVDARAIVYRFSTHSSPIFS